MTIATLTLVILMHGGLIKTVAITAPSMEVCHANKPYIVADYYRNDEKIVAITGKCDIFNLQVPT